MSRPHDIALAMPHARRAALVLACFGVVACNGITTLGTGGGPAGAAGTDAATAGTAGAGAAGGSAAGAGGLAAGVGGSAAGAGGSAAGAGGSTCVGSWESAVQPDPVAGGSNLIFADASGNGFFVSCGACFVRFDARTSSWGAEEALGSTSGLRVAFDRLGNGLVAGTSVSFSPLRVWRRDALEDAWASDVAMPDAVVGMHSQCDLAVAEDRAAILWRRDSGGMGIQSADFWVSWIDGTGGWRSRRLYDGGAPGSVFCEASITIGDQPIAVIGRFDGAYAFHYDAAADAWTEVRVSHANRFSGPAVVRPDGNGDVTAVWYEQVNPFQADQRSTLWSSRWSAAGGSWDAPRQIAESEDGRLIWDLRMSTSGSGSAIVAWRESPDFGTTHGRIRVVRRGSRDGTWVEPQTLAAESNRVAISVGPDGEAFAVWSDLSTEVTARRFDVSTASWEEARRVPGLSGPPGVAASGRGVAFAAAGGWVSRHCLP